MPYIHYSGIGCNDSQKHTIDEFLNIMTHAPGHYYEMRLLGFDMEYKNYDLPADFDKFTLEEWLDYTGAVYYEGEPVNVGPTTIQTQPKNLFKTNNAPGA